MTIALKIANDKHMARASKDRTGLFTDRPEFVITIETGKKISAWCNEGEPSNNANILQRINACKSLDELLKLYYDHPTDDKEILAVYTKRKKQFEKQPTPASLTTQKQSKNGTYSSKTNKKSKQGKLPPAPVNREIQNSTSSEDNSSKGNLSSAVVKREIDSDQFSEDKISNENIATVISTSKPFIEANTVEVSFEEVKDKHIIPVFIKDNEPVISHTEFIESMVYEVKQVYHSETILNPSIRLSHPIKGRIPEARNKPASELSEHERTIYYERMAFIIEIPSVYDDIEGSKLSLCVGGVKAYNLDNLYNRKGADEHFKIFIGFKNSVCTNLCIWTDGLQANLKVQNANQLMSCIKSLIERFNPVYQLRQTATLVDYQLSEQQFAQIIGRCRLYPHLPCNRKISIPSLYMGDTQIGMVCKEYYRNEHYSKNEDETINLWRLYNLFTGANKSSYIDNFLDRSANIYQFIENIKTVLQNKSNNWFLS